MLRWSERVVCSDSVENPAAVRKLIDSGCFDAGVFLITLSSNENEQLDIIRAAELKKHFVYERCGLIVGMCTTRSESIKIVAGMANAVLAETGSCNIRKYFETEEL